MIKETLISSAGVLPLDLCYVVPFAELFLMLPVNLGCYIYGDAPQSLRQVLIVFGTARSVFILNTLQKF